MNTLLALGAVLLTATLQAAGGKLSPAKQAAVLQRLQPAVVRVEYTLQYAHGQEPEGAGLLAKCPNCGRYHVSVGDDAIRDNRPMVAAGFLVAADTVVMPEPQIPARFVRSIRVRAGESVVDATPAGRAVGQPAIRLHLTAPIDGAKPLTFGSGAPAPHLLLTATPDEEGSLSMAVLPLPEAVVMRGDEPPFIGLPAPGLICTRQGKAVGFSFRERLPLEDTWQGNPLTTWSWHDTAAMAAQKKRLREIVDDCLPRVRLRFRTPEQGPGDPIARRYGLGSDEDETAPERNFPGVLLPEGRVLVLAALKPTETARLERIEVIRAQGKPAGAKFVASLKHIGALLAQLDESSAAHVQPAFCPPREWRDAPLWLAQVEIKGESRRSWLVPVRLAGLEPGREGRLFPKTFPGLEPGFLFDGEGGLLALPTPKRPQPSADQYSYYSYSNRDADLTPLAYLSDAIAHPAEAADPANRPLAEEEARKLLWAGFELQGLTPELAAANHVALEVKDGRTGAIVTVVHPHSPAAKAGVQPGWILLRVIPEGEQVPIDVRLGRDEAFGSMGDFPWEQLDQVSPAMFDRLPPPWPPAETGFNRFLAGLGRDARYTVDFFVDGRIVRKDFQVEPGPDHFGSAPKVKSAAVGLTVKNLTFEVRRYLTLPDDAPGVVIAKVEPGGKAAVAGVKPYELITEVNGQPVRDVAAFQKAVAKGGELRLSIRRMARSRVVNLRDVPAE